MDVYRLAEVARGIGADKVSVAGDRVRCACPLARWMHPKGRDDTPSGVMFPAGKHGDPIYTCQSCHWRGSVKDMVLLIWARSGINMFHWVEAVEGEQTTEAAEAKTDWQRNARTALGASFNPHQVKNRGAKEARKREKERVVSSDGKPFYDYLALAKADDSFEEIPWEKYEPYYGSVPRYAFDRGLKPETCKAWELGHDKNMKRLLFPMRNRKGTLVAISGRLYECPSCGKKGTIKPVGCEKCDYVDYDGLMEQCLSCGSDAVTRQRECCVHCHRHTPPKYLHSKGFKRNLMLFGEHMVKDAPGSKLYVVEGHLDAVKLWQAGYRPTVATLGSWPGEVQIEKIVEFNRFTIVVPDGDDAGRDFGSKVKRMLNDRVPVKVKDTPKGKDPGDLSSEELKSLLGRPVVDVDNTEITG